MGFAWPYRAGQEEAWPAPEGCSEAAAHGADGPGLWDCLPCIPASCGRIKSGRPVPPTPPPFRRACPLGTLEPAPPPCACEPWPWHRHSDSGPAGCGEGSCFHEW